MTSAAEGLERAYQGILETRMHGVPILNDALTVRALGFRGHVTGDPRGDGELGILITPWFMNLVLVPDAGAFTEVQNGEKLTLILPAGPVEFVMGRDEDVGPLLACSLFSPMERFDDQQGAEDTARQILDGLMTPPEPPVTSRRDLIRGRFKGTEDAS